jgi:hypothetical protein
VTAKANLLDATLSKSVYTITTTTFKTKKLRRFSELGIETVKKSNEIDRKRGEV